MRAIPKLILTGVILAAAGAGAYFYWAKPAEPVAEKEKSGRGGIQTVKTALAEKKSIPVSLQANGTVMAIDTVDVRPQVQNIVRTVHVKEGQDVVAGQLLFSLDARVDTANAEKTRAQVERDRADLADAEAVLKRNEELLAKKFVAPSVVESARNKVDALRATLRADSAGAQGSQVSLGFNRISASISGRLGSINVHPGSLAQPGGVPMVTIAKLDPVSVSFAVPESRLTFIRTTYPKGDAPVMVRLPNGKELRGKLSFIDNAVDVASGTIRMKAEFANPDKLLWPGAFVTISMISHTLEDVIAVPPQAIVIGPADKFVYLVQPDGSVKRQKVEVGAIEGGFAAITGVDAGQRVVIEGAQNLRPSSKVKEQQEGPKKEGRGGKEGKEGKQGKDGKSASSAPDASAAAVKTPA